MRFHFQMSNDACIRRLPQKPLAAPPRPSLNFIQIEDVFLEAMTLTFETRTRR